MADFDFSTALIVEDQRHAYSERRFQALGLLGQRLHMLVFTPSLAAYVSSAFVKPTVARCVVMSRKDKYPDPAMIDDENPEWGDETFSKARPASQVLPEIFPPALARQMLKPRGRPKAEVTKERITIRLSPEVVEAFRATGDDWQTRMDAALKDWLQTHSPASPEHRT